MTIPPEDSLNQNPTQIQIPETFEENEYGIAIICYSGKDDGVIRIILPKWITEMVEAISPDRKGEIYTQFITNAQPAFDKLILELGDEFEKNTKKMVP